MGSSKNWTIFRGHFYAFQGLFLRSMYRMELFFGLLKIKIFFGVLEIPDIFGRGGGGGGVNGRCWARAYVRGRNYSTPAPVSDTASMSSLELNLVKDSVQVRCADYTICS